ncbi:MAG: ABC transporter permease [Kiritimatiellae bacterium]|nr:ABC transporter permease [Kiritimatiellia bacterium]MDD5520582.1 ABC transporter permease [Kiritimatiellia bacterium]
MTGLRLSIRSALFYWRTHLSVLAGIILAGAVLVGAMLVGDSVRYSLMKSALLRLGNVHYALNTQGRFFRQDLAERLEKEAKTLVAPALLLRGIAIRQENTDEKSRQVNNIQVIGVDRRFWGLSGNSVVTFAEDEIAVNAKLAAELCLKTGDEISIRIGKPSLLSRDAPLSSRKGDDTVRGTFSIAKIVSDGELGRFSLTANQIVPCNVFVNLSWLQKNVFLEDKVDLLLAAGKEDLTVEKLNGVIKKVWRIEDIGLILRDFEGRGLFQLESERIFMDPAITRAALNIEKPVGTLTYLVNSISKEDRDGSRRTPYSFITALAPSADRALGPVPPDMTDDEIILNRWLADCLSARTGETIAVSYYELTPSNKFIEKSRSFKVRHILEMSDIADEKDLGPKFPGLTDADRCTEWDIGMPLEKDKVEDKANEAYWKAYRATPKAFVTLKAGQEMWSNRFGNLTSVRFPVARCGKELIVETLRQRINPAETGLSFAPVREAALKAAGEAMDFGQLFLGMSFFLIVAGLMLTGLLFAFGIQQRSEEMGILLAVGYRPGHVRHLLMQESCLLAVVGSIAGAFLGTLYTRALIWGLGNYWQGAVANSAIQYHAEPVTVIKGAVMSFLCAMFSLVIAVRKQSVRPARELLTVDFSQSYEPAGSVPGKGRLLGMLSLAGVAIALGIIGYSAMTGMHNAVETFFMAGTLFLIAFLGLSREVLVRLDQMCRGLSVTVLGLRNAGRRRGRSLTVTGLLACGCFLVFAVSSMQEDIGADAVKRSSGTGGFALFGESSFPIQMDLNSVEGRKKVKLEREQDLKNVEIVSLKVRDGDDASCLNLNRAQSPRLIGVDPQEFVKRKAFMAPDNREQNWKLLAEQLPDGVVPGLAGDSNTAMWGLKKKVGREKGDTLTYRDERGELFKVKLVGSLPMRLSVFQGSILIPAGSFTAKYPSENGYRMFLFDVPWGTERNVMELLAGKLGKFGVNISTTVERLKEFYSVESTYMAMFLVLGGLGLLLGSAGMGIVVLRNILERRNELALFKAVGYSDANVRRVVLTEHWLILAMGLMTGVVSSLAAMWPSFHAPGVRLPYMTMALFISGIAVFQLLWIISSVRIAMRQSMISALRNE